MIINNNIPALNTYRQMGINQKSNANAMEKLSSGLRINKAGDDAAGLAISEKMRAQVRGLDQASRNSQDGISMIQTAEGALQETHNILQRMRELATQAANDTNVEVDRNEIQKEMNALTSEINRIGNTTEFNTQKVLNGGPVQNSSINATSETVTIGAEAVAAAQSKFEVTIGNDAVAGDTFTFGGVTITAGEGNYTLDNTSATTAAEAIKTALEADSDFSANWSVTNTTGKLEFTAKATGEYAGSKGNIAFPTKTGTLTLTTPAQTTYGVDAKDETVATNVITFSKVPTEGSTIEIGETSAESTENKIGFYDSKSGNFASAEEAKKALGTENIIDISGKSASEIASEISKLDISNANLSASGNTVVVAAVTGGEAGNVEAEIKLNNSSEGLASSVNSGTLANSDLSALAATSKISVQVGDNSFELDVTDTSGIKFNFGNIATAGHAEQTRLISAFADAEDSAGNKLSEVANISIENGKLSIIAKEVGADNISVNVEGAGAEVAKVQTLLGMGTSTSLVGNAGVDAYEGTTGGEVFKSTFQVGANQGQSMTITIGDMRANALNITGTSASSAHSVVDGAKFTSTANVTDGTNNDNVEFALDVSSHESASAAVKVINNAIEKVSAQRSDLGAFQNRLEHTISNLGTSSENLQAAESRIRDVDMAKEVMEMTRTNILSQASQAMLAQANQKPQSVLQLLG